MTLRETLHGKTATERHIIKASAFADLGIPPTITRQGWTLTFPRPITVNGRGFLTIWVHVADPQGNRVPISNPIIITNPPLLVPDGVGGFREDLLAALMDVIVQTVRSVTHRPFPES